MGLIARVPAVAAIVAAVSIVYREAPAGYFFEDDFQWLAGTLTYDPATIVQLAGRTHFYRPVVELYFWLGLPLFDGSPALFHLASVVVHAVNGILLFLIGRAIARSDLFGLAAALPFVVMPGYVEAVAWIGALAEPVGALFGFLSIWFFLQYRERKRLALRGLSVMAFALSLLTHESSVVFLPLLVLADWAARAEQRLVPHTRAGWVERVRVYAPFAAVTLLYLAIDLSINRSNYLVAEGHYRAGVHVVRNLLAYIVSLYVGKQHVLSHVAVAAVLVLLFVRGSRRARFAAGWMVVALLPFLFFTSGIASRYQYLPAAGFGLLLAEGVRWLADRLMGRTSAPVRIGILAVLIAVLTVRFGVFASEAVINFVNRTRHYERFAEQLRRQHPHLEPGARVVIEQPDTPQLQHQYLEALVRWEFRDPTIQVVLRGASR